MRKIRVLDSETIDKIAAGEVVERPASVVKELVENAIDAGARAITVEIKEGGISLIRVTDNGSGIPADQLDLAFCRHATSKINSAEDLDSILSLGFRGEALSSISAVSKVEVITKTSEGLNGTRYLVEGGAYIGKDEIGAPEGTTMLVRNLFYNTPVRKKFLKSAQTEGGYVADLMEHLALSRPDISFKYLLNGQNRFYTSGNGELKEVIYRIYGKEISKAVIPVSLLQDGIQITGFLGKPVLVRANRNYEIYYINGRFIKSQMLSKAIEEGYKEYLMQHKFPMCVLHFTMDTARVDVNVHPTKMDVRFSDAAFVSRIVSELIEKALKNTEMIPQETVGSIKDEKEELQKERAQELKKSYPEPFERTRVNAVLDETMPYTVASKTQTVSCTANIKNELQPFGEDIWFTSATELPIEEAVPKEATGKAAGWSENPGEDVLCREAQIEDLTQQDVTGKAVVCQEIQGEGLIQQETPCEDALPENSWEKSEQAQAVQMNFFEEKILTVQNKDRFHIIGQVFDTYWMVEFEDKLLIIDQHAAHEKVKYERIMKRFREGGNMSQPLLLPLIVTLSGKEEQILLQNMDAFSAFGFEIEPFGGNEYAIRGVPYELFGFGEEEIFLSVLDELSEEGSTLKSPKLYEEKIASMSCKAAIKGNHSMTREEMEKLIEELLSLENPYNCPHGRPTIITISQTEMEKKFKRIVS